MNDKQLVSIRKVSKRFPVGRGEFTALDGIDLEIGAGEFVGLIGPSGSGKTTLLNIIGSLDSPSEGEAIVLGQSVSTLSSRQAAALRNRSLGFIFQSYNLLPAYSVYENVEFPLLLLGLPAAERKEKILSTLAQIGLADKLKSKPAQLSGGECQRVAIARAMVKSPRIVLADEPTANLDAANSYRILDTMIELNETLGTTFIFASHDQKVIERLRRVITLNDGKIVADESQQPVARAAQASAAASQLQAAEA